MSRRNTKWYNPDFLFEGVLNGNIAALSKSITLVESKNNQDQQIASRLLDRLHQHEIDNPKKTIRIGITGTPGVGKSTFIEALGVQLTKSYKVAILAVDPSSPVSGGSILGDKTRMERLSQEPNAYIRPSPNTGIFGGLASHTYESILLCEASGFDIILIETVGVGQSEYLVNNLCDCFVLLQLLGAGDDLQGIKKGMMEMVDLMVLNKIEGELVKKGEQAIGMYKSAFELLQNKPHGVPVGFTLNSSLKEDSVKKTWQAIKKYFDLLLKEGYIEEKRTKQSNFWLTYYIKHSFEKLLFEDPTLIERWKIAKSKVEKKEQSVYSALVSFLNISE